MKRWSLRVFVVGALALTTMGILRAIEDRMVFAGTERPADPDAFAHWPQLERWTLPVDGGEVEAWFIRAPRVDGPAPAVIFAHGNYELIEDWVEEFESYGLLGVHVLLPEFRGYGRSGGRPSADAIIGDFIQFYDRLAKHPAVDPKRIIAQGRSLGGGVICGLVEQRPVAALILQSTFTSLQEMARRMFVPAALVRNRFDCLNAVRNFAGPTLIVHGTRDLTIPVTHGQQLHEAAPQSELILYRAGHNDCPPTGSDYWQQLEEFLRQHDILSPPLT